MSVRVCVSVCFARIYCLRLIIHKFCELKQKICTLLVLWLLSKQYLDWPIIFFTSKHAISGINLFLSCI